MGDIFIKVLFFQVLVAIVVIFILKKILNLQLEELAVKKLEYIKLDDEELGLEALTLVAPGKISLALQSKIDYICKKKFGRPLRFVIKTDRSLKGGLVIRLKKIIIDYSLIGRLKESGMLRSK